MIRGRKAGFAPGILAQHGESHLHLPLFSLLIHPPVLLQPFQRANDAPLNGELVVPAGGADFFCVEENERIVTHPTLVAAGIFEPGIEIERLTNNANGVVDPDVFVGAKVVSLDVVFGFQRSLHLNHL